MKDEYLYMVQATSKYNPGYVTIKVGYTTNPTKRLKQLKSRNKYFEYSEMALFKNRVKQYNYKYDEEHLHSTNTYHRVRVGKDTIPDGYTEHYESYYMPDLYNQLVDMGYYWINEPIIEEAA